MQSIIDTHLHTWDLNRCSYYWLEGNDSILAQSYFIEQVNPQLEEAGVTSAVLVQATNQLKESDWLLSLSESHNWIEGAIIWLPLMDPQACERALEKYLTNPWFKGVRHQIHDEPNEKWLLQPSVVESLQMLASHNIPYDLVGIKNCHTRTALKLAEKLPDLKMVFDHLNQPPISNNIAKEFGEWGMLMKEASLNPNFSIKVSGLGATTAKGKEWRSVDIKPFVEYVLEIFGTGRVFCGSDWPVAELSGSYNYTWQQYREVLQQLLTPDELDKVYQQNARKFYNL
ncbi:MAG TPA: amidohydrolase family protein [Cytophagaceae bacterium]|jgi:L-fuconolactonase